MTFDPFALIPTATTAPLNLDLPQEYKSILPQLPPQDYTQTQAGVQAKPDSNKTFEYFLSQAKTPNTPLYEYSFEDDKRYSNPYLQFNPRPLGGKDTEDIYAGFQGGGEQLWNALVKTGATAGSSFISSFSSLGSSIDAIRGGQPFDEDSYLGETQGWLRELENDYPNYYSAWEREHPFQSAVPFSGGFTNFWGDKVLKNVGFTVGSLAASFLVDAGINLATGGTGTPATFILAANQIKKAVTPLKNAFRNLSKTTALNKVDDLAGVARVGEGINKGLNTMNQAYNLKRALQFTGTTYFAAQGEAMIEGYQTYWDTKAKLYKQAADQGKLNLDQIQGIEETAQAAANTTTALNLPIIMASNLLQFPTIFGGSSLLKRFDSPFLEIVNKQGLTVVNNYSKKQAWVNTMKELTKDFITEGGEEGYQYYIGNSIHDYYVDKFNGDATDSLSKYLGKQLPKTVQDEKFWESVVIGGLAGGLMGGYKPIKQNLIGANERTNRAVETLKPVLERFNSTVKDYVHFAETVEHEQDKDTVNKFQTAHKAIYSTVHDSLKYGIYQNFQDSIEDLKNLPVEEYNKLFDTEFTETQKLRHLNGVQKESQKIKSDLTEVNKFFQVNPFDSPYVTKRLSDIFKVDQTKIEPLKAKLFEDFKELTAYNISRLRNTNLRVSEILDELATMGIDNSVLPVLTNLVSLQGIKEYKKLKQVQLEVLEDELKYYETLDNASTIEDRLGIIKKQRRLKKTIDTLDNFSTEKQVQDSLDNIKKLIWIEELNENQLDKEEFLSKQNELEKQQDIALKTAEELENQTTKPEEKVVEQVETIAKIVPLEQVEVEDVTQPNQIDIFNKNFAGLEVGDTFTVELSTEGGTFTLLTKQPFVIAEKDGIEYHFMPDRVVKHDNGEQILRYTLDNIGVQKIDKVEPVIKEQTAVKINARKQIIMDLLEYDGNIEQVFTKNGYLNVKGIYVHPDVVDTFNKLETETIELLKNNGIVYVDNLSTDGAAGVTLGYKYGEQSIMGIGLANIGLFNNPNQIALHELGHVIWEKLSKEEQDLFYDGNPITEHGRGVLNPTGKFKDLYGQGSAYGEEDFAQAFAESKGSLKEVFKRKKGTTNPKKEIISKLQERKEVIDSKKGKAVKPVKDGIYLIEGDYTNAWRYVDENTAVPLTLVVVGNRIEYIGNLDKGVKQKITEGYLLDDKYINKKQEELVLSKESIFSMEVQTISQEQLDTLEMTDKEINVPLTEQDNLSKFINKTSISDTLRQVLEWRIGKGINIDC